MKLLCLGLDGFDHREWGKHMADLGYQYAVLHSPLPASGPAWTSIYTGMTPAEHGVRDTWGRAMPGSKTHADVCNRAVWNLLPGVSCAICNLPVTDPPSKVDGFMVSGFYQRPDAYWPPTLAMPQNWLQLSDLCWTDGIADMGTWRNALYGAGKTYAARWTFSCCDRLLDWFVRAVGDRDIDLGWLAFTYPDRLLHAWPGDPDIFLFIAELTRGIIKRLEQTLAPDAMLIMSDHGFSETEDEHTKQGVIAWRGLQMARTKFTNWDIAHIVAARFGVTLGGAGAYSEEDIAVINQRLRDLGYLG